MEEDGAPQRPRICDVEAVSQNTAETQLPPQQEIISRMSRIKRGVGFLLGSCLHAGATYYLFTFGTDVSMDTATTWLMLILLGVVVDIGCL
jgi:hypothetical protein